MKYTHWTKFLPEAGIITRRGDEQESIQRQIAHHQKQIRALKLEFKKNEESLTEFCIDPDYWTEEEVDRAKKRAEEKTSKLSDRP